MYFFFKHLGFENMVEICLLTDVKKKSFYDHIAVSCIRTMSSVLKNILL